MEITAQHIGHYVRVLAGMLNTFVFVLDVNSANGMVQVRHMDGSTGWGFNSAFAPVTEDEELAAAIEWGLASGQLVDAVDWMAQQDDDLGEDIWPDSPCSNPIEEDEPVEDADAQAEAAALAGLDPEPRRSKTLGEMSPAERKDAIARAAAAFQAELTATAPAIGAVLEAAEAALVEDIEASNAITPHFEAVSVTGDQMNQADSLGRSTVEADTAREMLAELYGPEIADHAILLTIAGQDFHGHAVVRVDANGIKSAPRFMVAAATGSLSRVLVKVREIS